MTSYTKVTDSTIVSEINKLRAKGVPDKLLTLKLAQILPLKRRTIQERVKALKSAKKMKPAKAVVATKSVQVKGTSKSTVVTVLELLLETLATQAASLKSTNYLATELLKVLRSDSGKVVNPQNSKYAEFDKLFRKKLNDTIEAYGGWIHPRVAETNKFPLVTGSAIKDLKHRTKEFLQVSSWDEITALGVINALEWLNAETGNRFTFFTTTILELTGYLDVGHAKAASQLALDLTQEQTNKQGA